MITLSKLYAIVDATRFPDAQAMCAFSDELIAGGVTLLQYRNRTANARERRKQSRELKGRLSNSVKLIRNDRADFCLAAEWNGVNVGKTDLRPEAPEK